MMQAFCMDTTSCSADGGPPGKIGPGHENEGLDGSFARISPVWPFG